MNGWIEGWKDDAISMLKNTDVSFIYFYYYYYFLILIFWKFY